MRRLIRKLTLDIQRQQRHTQRAHDKSQLLTRQHQAFQTSPPLGWQSRASHSYFVR